MEGCRLKREKMRIRILNDPLGLLKERDSGHLFSSRQSCFVSVVGGMVAIFPCPHDSFSFVLKYSEGVWGSIESGSHRC